MKHTGTLTITIMSQNNFKKLTEVLGSIYIYKGAVFIAPKLEKAGNIHIHEGAIFTAPKLKKVGNINIYEGTTFAGSKLKKAGSIDVRQGVTLTVPKLKEAGDIFISKNATFTAPELKKAGNLYVIQNATVTVLKLEKLRSIFARQNAIFIAPKLKEAKFISVRQGVTLTALTIKIENNIARFNNKEYKIVNYDNLTFFVDHEKMMKEFKIYSGLMSVSIVNKKIIGEKAYIAQKGEYTAHGKTIKEAISTVQFKIISEAFKNDPINEDTIITDDYYRLITGACSIGVKHWRKQNEIKVKKITAKELLPILEKTNAYGLEEFKQLISF